MAKPKALMVKLAWWFLLVGQFLVALGERGEVVDAPFTPAAINLANDSVTLPIYPAVTSDGTPVYFIVTEASTKEAAAAWGASHAPVLAQTARSAVVQRAAPVNSKTTAVKPGQLLRVNSTVDFLHGTRSVVPDPATGFPPRNFSFSAQGNEGYSPLLLLPDGTVLNAPHVAVVQSGGRLALHPKVASVTADRKAAVLALTHGFSQGKPIVYISTEASDPLAATLENVPYVPLLAKTPQPALVDLVAFANGQTGKGNPQRQGLGSALKDGLGPLNIAANTPASPVYSPLWAVNLAKWTGTAGDRQTSVASVKALAASGKVSSLDPMHPTATPELQPSGIVVNCPIMATIRQPPKVGDKAIFSSGGGGSSCARSPLGYNCMVRPQPGVAIHYSLGGNQPPQNPCTSSGSAPEMSVVDKDTVPQRLAHFALEATTPGFVAMSFPQTPGKMWPADAVIGSGSTSGATPSQVQAYHLTRYAVSAADANDGWALHKGLIDQGGKRVVCFSRALDAPGAAVVKSINPSTALPINWAISDSNSLQQMHSQMGSATIDLQGGAAVISNSGAAANQLAYRVAHGVMMLLAFLLLMPSAVLMARHKWLFGDKEAGTIKGVWFTIHMGCNIAASLLAVVAAALIFARFQWAGRADASPYYTYHRWFGMAGLAMVFAQGLLGATRPHLGTKRRPIWRRMHQMLGWLTLVVGIGVSYMGISLIHDLSGLSLAYWLGPALATTGVLLLAGLLLEVNKFKLQRAGNYDKHTHTVAGAAGLPIQGASSGVATSSTGK